MYLVLQSFEISTMCANSSNNLKNSNFLESSTLTLFNYKLQSWELSKEQNYSFSSYI